MRPWLVEQGCVLPTLERKATKQKRKRRVEATPVEEVPGPEGELVEEPSLVPEGELAGLGVDEEGVGENQCTFLKRTLITCTFSLDNSEVQSVRYSGSST